MEFIDEDLAQRLLGVKANPGQKMQRDAYGFLGYKIVPKVRDRSDLHHVRVPDGLQAADEKNSCL